MKKNIKSEQHKLHRGLVWLLALSSSSLPAIKQSYAENGISEKAYFEEFPVVLSASRLRQPISETPNAVTVIDRDMIKASGFRNIADLFKLVPGMYADYRDGYKPVVSYRGGTDEYTRRMQVLIDGRSVYLAPFNTVDWEDLPLHVNDIERIEVVRGPAATSYGSNSILGVINIITRDAFALNGGSVSVTKGNAGGAGISDTVAHLGRVGEKLSYRLTFGMRSDNGFDFPKNSPNWLNGFNDSSATHFASLRSSYQMTGVDSLDLQLGFSNGVRAEGHPANQSTPPHNKESDSSHQQLSWLHIFDSGDDIKVNYYHISRNAKNEWSTLPVSIPPLGSFIFPLNENYRVARHEFEIQHTFHTSSNNRLVWGVASRKDSVDAPTTFATSQSVRSHRLFAHDEWRVLPKLLLNAGGMLEKDGVTGGRKFSPRAAVNFHLTSEHTFRASISVAYRNPALVEERSDYHFKLGGAPLPLTYRVWHSSGELRPERTLSREIGYLGNFSNGWSVDVRAFNDHVNDIIWIDENVVPDPLNIKRTWNLSLPQDFRNMFMARYTGLENSVRYAWSEAKNSLTFSFAHQNVSCSPIGSPYISRLPDAAFTGANHTPDFIRNFVLARYAAQIQACERTVPLNSGSLLYIGQLSDDISLGVGYYQQGTLQILDGESQPLTRRMNVRIAKQFKSFGGLGRIGGGEVALAVQNVFQHNNGESVGYSGYLFDRRAYVTATLNF